MKKSRFTEEKIIAVLKQGEAGAKMSELARKNGVSEATVLEPTGPSAQARPIRSLLQSSARPQRARGENSGRTARPCCAPNRPATAVLLASTPA
jgi:hypothetical protein